MPCSPTSLQIFNAVTDRTVTLDGVARLCAAAAGTQAHIVHYVPGSLGVDVKKAFPFRPTHFYAEPRAAKVRLGWAPSHDIPGMLKERYAYYVASGRDKKDLEAKFATDEVILKALSS